MNLAGKIACRTIGTAGIGIALYDASSVCRQFARNYAEKEQSEYLEKAYYNSRTTDTVSFSDNFIRKKTFDLRSRNPLPGFWGNIKGGSKGIFYSLGNNLPTVLCSALALTCKGTIAKAGAIGTGLSLCWSVLRNGYGAGKQNPIG